MQREISRYLKNPGIGTKAQPGAETSAGTGKTGEKR